jgi:hypothetical protein
MIVEGVPSDAVACRVYGSLVRGELDELSDIDLLIAIDRPIEDRERESVRSADGMNRHLSVSWYSSERLTFLWSEGDLFAWHLFGESRSVSLKGVDFIDRLGRPAPYRSALADIDELIDIMTGSAAAVEACPGNLTYEAGILYVCCRNIALCASWYTQEGLCFSRYSPYVNQLRTGVAFCVDASTYASLVRARLKGTRNLPWSGLSRAAFFETCSVAREWAFKTREFVERRSRS